MTDDCQAHILNAKICLTALIDESKERHQRWYRIQQLLKLELDTGLSASLQNASRLPVGRAKSLSTKRLKDSALDTSSCKSLAVQAVAVASVSDAAA